MCEIFMVVVNLGDFVSIRTCEFFVAWVVNLCKKKALPPRRVPNLIQRMYFSRIIYFTV